MPSWPEHVERVAAFLREAGAEARLEELVASAATAEAAAEAIGCPAHRVVKSLVFVCEGRPLLALAPGNRRVDPGKVARATSAKRARIADSAEVVAATGFQPGAVAPFPLLAIRTVLVERTLLSEPQVWVGGGSTRHMVVLQPLELVRLTRAVAADLLPESA